MAYDDRHEVTLYQHRLEGIVNSHLSRDLAGSATEGLQVGCGESVNTISVVYGVAGILRSWDGS